MLTEEQFCALAKKHMDMIFRIAFNYLKDRNEADDITQNVLLKLLDAKKEFESDEHIKYWLIRVTINESKKTLRSPWRNTEPIEDYASTIAFSMPEQGGVFTALMELPRKYRIVIHLFYYEEYAIGEISRILRCSPGTVKSQLSRGRKLLKSKLTEDWNDDE